MKISTLLPTPEEMLQIAVESTRRPSSAFLPVAEKLSTFHKRQRSSQKSSVYLCYLQYFLYLIDNEEEVIKHAFGANPNNPVIALRLRRLNIAARTFGNLRIFALIEEFGIDEQQALYVLFSKGWRVWLPYGKYTLQSPEAQTSNELHYGTNDGARKNLLDFHERVAPQTLDS